MQEKLNILVSAYACSPYHGSEPGMGWNFIKAISEHHETWVITEQIEFKNDLEKYVEENPKYKKINFYYIPRKQNNTLKKIWPPSYYWYYKGWQKKAYKLAKKLDEEQNFNIIHQLNQTGFREPGYLWKLKKPFIWGPIGGMEMSPWKFLKSMGTYGFLFYLARNIINILQINFAKRPRKAAKRNNNQLIAATYETKLKIEKYWNKSSTVISEVGITNFVSANLQIREENEPIKIIWSGEHTNGKSLNLLLRSLFLLKDVKYELHVLGNGPKNKEWKELAKKLEIDENIKWHGWLPKCDALNVMASGHLFCLTSLKDLTSSVILEALSQSLPVICLDHCGFRDVIDQTCGYKISLISPSQVISEIASIIKHLYTNERLRQNLSKGAFQRAGAYNWEDKMKQLDEIYTSLLTSNDDFQVK